MAKYKYLGIYLFLGSIVPCLGGKGNPFQEDLAPLAPSNPQFFSSENRQFSEMSSQAVSTSHLRQDLPYSNLNYSTQQFYQVPQNYNPGPQSFGEFPNSVIAPQPFRSLVPSERGISYHHTSPQSSHPFQRGDLAHSYVPENFVNTSYSGVYQAPFAPQNNLAVRSHLETPNPTLMGLPSASSLQDKRELNSRPLQMISSNSYNPNSNPSFNSTQLADNYRSFSSNSFSNLRPQNSEGIKVNEYPLQRSKFIITRLSAVLQLDTLVAQKIEKLLFPLTLEVDSRNNYSITNNTGLYFPSYRSYTIEFANRKNFLEALGVRI